MKGGAAAVSGGDVEPMAEAGDAMPSDALEVGRILDGWGLKGWLRVQPFSEDASALLRAKRWHIAPPKKEGFARLPGVAKRWKASLDIVSSRVHGDAVVAQVVGVDDRTGADALRGARIFVSRANFPKVGPDEFYWVDLIGMAVVNREGHRFGAVVGLLSTGPQSVLRVKPDPSTTANADPDATADPVEDAANESSATDERLIPFVDAYVDRVDMASRTITVDWGLDY